MAAEIKVDKDIEEVRAIIKEIDAVQGEVNKIQSAWNAYDKSIPSKNIGDDEIAVLFKKLLSTKDYRYIPTTATKLDENIIADGEGDNSLRKGLFEKLVTRNETDTNQRVSDNIRATFEKTLKELCEKLIAIKPTTPESDSSIAENEYTTLINNIGNFNSNKFTLTPIYSETTTTEDPSTRKQKITQFINEAKSKYDSSGKDDQYTITERQNIVTYFGRSENKFDTFFKPVTDSQTIITTKCNDIVSKLTDIATKYSGLDSRIKKDVLEKLKPKNITEKTNITNIIDTVTDIIAKFKEDHKIHSTITAVTIRGGAHNKKKKVGGAKVDRDNMVEKFTKISEYITNLKTIASELYKGLNRFSDPETGDSPSKNEESIFNRLFEKYMRTKDDNTDKGGPFIASTQLINDLKSNDLYPDEILKIDMRDKFVFVATTLFMRIVALIIIEMIIDRKIITRMDTAIFWYGVTMTVFITLFVLIVNFDSYKLRIIFNYVNFHIGYSTTLSYIFQLWLFGGMVYYIMLKINDDVITSASNDEDRARLKHKVQVISMITWFFLSIGVLIM